MDGVFDISRRVRRRSAMMLALLVFLAAPRWPSASWRRCVCAARSSAAPPASPSIDRQRRRSACVARLEPEGRASACSTTPPSTIRRATTTSDMKVLRRRLMQAGIFEARAVGYFFVGAHRACGRSRRSRSSSSRRWSSTLQRLARSGCSVDRWRHLRLCRPELLSRPAHRQAPQASTAVGFPGFHGSAGGVRRFRAEHGGGARSGRPRARRFLSVALPPTSTWPISRSAPAARMTDALEHLGDRLGLEEARSFATLIQQSAELGSSITDALRVYSRRHAPQAALARRGEGLQPAGQARRCR